MATEVMAAIAVYRTADRDGEGDGPCRGGDSDGDGAAVVVVVADGKEEGGGRGQEVVAALGVAVLKATVVGDARCGDGTAAVVVRYAVRGYSAAVLTSAPSPSRSPVSTNARPNDPALNTVAASVE